MCFEHEELKERVYGLENNDPDFIFHHESGTRFCGYWICAIKKVNNKRKRGDCVGFTVWNKKEEKRQR